MQKIRLELAHHIRLQMMRTHDEQILFGGAYGTIATDSKTYMSDILPALYAAHSFENTVSFADEPISNIEALLVGESIRIKNYFSVQAIAI